MTFQVDLSNCDREPIHLSGAIQPHGVLLVLSVPGLAILQLSANAAEVLGVSGPLQGRSIGEILDGDSAATLAQLTGEDSRANATLIKAAALDGDAVFDAIVRRIPEGLLVELEPATSPDRLSFNDFYLQARTAVARLQSATEVEALCRSAAVEVRAMTGFDRVMVYRFDRKDNGHVIAENAREGLESYLDLHYPASDIPAQARRLYLVNRLRLIVDVSYRPVPIEPPLSPVTREPLDLTYSVLRSVSPIHVEYLQNMGIHASMSVSLVVEGRLWGLLICHHYAPRFVSYDVRAACDFLSQTLSWLITAGERADRLQQRTRVDDRLRVLIQHLSEEDDLVAGLGQGAQELLAIVDATGAALVHAGKTTTFGVTPPPPIVETVARWLRSRDGRGLFATERLASQMPWAAGYAEMAGLLAVPLDREGESHLLWFRPGVERTVNWAGDPNKTASLEEGAPRLSPRGSFALWKETVQGESHPWRPWQLEIAAELGHAIAAIVLRRAAVLEALNRELKATSEELRLANLAKDDFLATLSHELRTPLSAMLGWIRLARSNQLDSDRMAHAFDVIERNARTQAKLIEDLLDVSRIISGKMRLDVQAINLLDVARAALESIRPSADAKSISIHSVLDPGASIIMGDPARLQQVVWNLLSNAVKFTQKEGRVHLHLTRAESSAAITISDNGEGIDLDFLPHVFDRFRQAYGGIDRTHQGLGLGLAIVRHLVELHGGTVSAFSEGKGHGAIFTVHLPLSPLRAEPVDIPAGGGEPPVSDVDCPPQLQGLRVVVVDDEPDARELLLAELSRCGAVVQLAETAAEALQLVSAWRPDALISDIGLPQMDGYMLIQAVRRLPDDQGGRTPALALTAYASSQDRVRAFRAGFQAHLAKPIELHELLAVLASISGRIG